MKHRLSFAGSVILVISLLCFVSCTKDYDEFFRFDNVGGPLVFYYNLDGATLSISDKNDTSEPSICYHPEDDPLWVVELDWISARYSPDSNRLLLMALNNQTNKRRSARIYGVLKSGKQIMIQIEQVE